MRTFIGICLILSLVSFTARAEKGPQALQKSVAQTIAADQKAGEKAQSWAEERSAILSQIRELKRLKRWTAHQREKYQIYIQKQEDAIAELKRRQKAAKQIRMELAPYLDTVYERLEAFVNADLPFLPGERRKRLAFLQEALNDYHLGLDEKTRQVLEALQAEAGYGSTSERSQGTIEINGVATQVELLRLGRVGLYYQTLDGQRIGWFDREAGAWQPLPQKYRRELKWAMEMAEKKRTPELISLPVGGPDS